VVVRSNKGNEPAKLNIMSEFKFSCPNCGQHIQGDERWSGREINCPACQQPLVVPSQGSPTPEEIAASSGPVTKPPPGKKVRYQRYEDVPWYRRSTLNHILAISGFFCFPFLVWWVVAMCLSGDIYQNKRDKDGYLKTWGMFSKVFSVFLVVIQVLAVILYIVFIIGAETANRTRQQEATVPEKSGQPAQISRDSGRASSAGDAASAPGASDRQSFHCVNNLKQIGLSFRLWAIDRPIDQDCEFPFNLSTKVGGTKELCDRGSDGFDRNAVRHFQVMSNELSDPKILVCPADTAKRPATDFSKLQAANVSYLLRSGTNILDGLTNEVLAVCPIHSHRLYCDASVKRGASR